MSSLSLSNNSGSVEIWKRGNVEMCLGCLYVVTLEVWKSGNLEMCLGCLYVVTLEVWKCVLVVFI